MRLTQFTDFALRLLIFVAANPDRRTTIAEVAAAYGISRSHLMKVASKLSQADILRPSRGRGGGLALARSATDISLGDIVRATEPDFALVGCMAGEKCEIAANCRLPNALQDALRAFLQTADQYCLAGFVNADLSPPEPGRCLPGS